ncbi:uncharacterized protein LOC142356044 [Convolutriloba macropyga]|uniref:uncharacterized protein LOC142356044 n=1 Tax=Convolutriloba macropyga TaxID=536237 RepID=UPI003F51FA43
MLPRLHWLSPRGASASCPVDAACAYDTTTETRTGQQTDPQDGMDVTTADNSPVALQRPVGAMVSDLELAASSPRRIHCLKDASVWSRFAGWVKSGCGRCRGGCRRLCSNSSLRSAWRQHTTCRHRG